MSDQIKTESAMHFKEVESLCGVARLAVIQAMANAANIEDAEFRDDAIETIAGTINDFITMFRGE